MKAALDQFNPSNVLVVDPKFKQSNTPVLSFDYELAFPDQDHCKLYEKAVAFV